MDSERFLKQIAFITEIDRLKKVIRQTSLTDASRRENVAEHSWHIALMAILLAEYANESSIKIGIVVKMLLIHDIVEIDAGDTFLYDDENTELKSEKELKAAKRIFSLLPHDQAEIYLALWEEFEAAISPEAKFAKSIDALQPILLAYQNEGWSWKKHKLEKQRVLEKKESMKHGSQELWKYTQQLLDKAEQLGFFEHE